MQEMTIVDLPNGNDFILVFAGISEQSEKEVDFGKMMSDTGAKAVIVFREECAVNRVGL